MSVNAEDSTKENVKWNTISTLSGSIYNSSTVDLHEEDNERRVEPAPQPVLDLPSNRVFIITTISISFIIILGISRKMMWSNPY
ncbi:MAG: hypothetical protein IMZ52_02500 [Actinobacteria bacterium]|nr:hypothetical protein [Actinomycetota bacterium]